MKSLLYLDDTRKIPDVNGDIDVTFEEADLTRGATLPGRFLLEIGDNFPGPFKVTWSAKPSAPLNVVAFAGTGTSNVAVRWDVSLKPNEHVTSYNVYRSINGLTGPWLLLISPGIYQPDSTHFGFTDITTTSGVTYWYRVHGVNTYGEGAPGYSNSVTAATVGTVPQILVQPMSQVIFTGDGVTMYVVATDFLGGSDVTYLWQYSVDNITWNDTATTTSSWSISDVLIAHGAYYRCVVANPYGSVTSNVALLFVITSPFTGFVVPVHRVQTDGYAWIESSWPTPLMQPGFPVNFYQWFYQVDGGAWWYMRATANFLNYWIGNGAVSGSTVSFYVRAHVDIPSFGLSSEVNSNVVTVVLDAPVSTPPVITVQPQDQTVATGSNVTFGVTVTSIGTVLNYKWYFNGSLIATHTTAALSDSLTLTNVDSGAVGGYYVTVTDDHGSTTSRTAQLNLTVVHYGPTVNSYINLGEVIESQSSLMFVNAVGDSPLLYQWKKDGVNITGATTDTYVIPFTLKLRDQGVYTCFVSNDYGNASVECPLSVDNIFNYSSILDDTWGGGWITLPNDHTSGLVFGGITTGIFEFGFRYTGSAWQLQLFVLVSGSPTLSDYFGIAVRRWTGGAWENIAYIQDPHTGNFVVPFRAGTEKVFFSIGATIQSNANVSFNTRFQMLSAPGGLGSIYAYS